jgi:hypothetical protein
MNVYPQQRQQSASEPFICKPHLPNHNIQPAQAPIQLQRQPPRPDAYPTWQENQSLGAMAQQIADLQVQLDRMTGYDGLSNGSPARPYTTKAVVNSVQKRDSGLATLFLDGGPTHHCVRNRMLLYDSTASTINTVIVADGEEHNVLCEGSMMIETPSGGHAYHHVLCVPTSVVNLLSPPQLDEQGYQIVHGTGEVIVANKEGEQCLYGMLQDGLYKIDGQIAISYEDGPRIPLPSSSSIASVLPAAVNLATSPQLSLLHRRLGHPGMKATKCLMSGNVVLGRLHRTANCTDDYCEVCKSSKECRAHIGSSSQSATAPLDKVHIDIMGPFRFPDIGGHRYTGTLYDHFTGYGEVLLMTHKSRSEYYPAKGHLSVAAAN